MLKHCMGVSTARVSEVRRAFGEGLARRVCNRRLSIDRAAEESKQKRGLKLRLDKGFLSRTPFICQSLFAT